MYCYKLHTQFYDLIYILFAHLQWDIKRKSTSNTKLILTLTALQGLHDEACWTHQPVTTNCMSAHSYIVIVNYPYLVCVLNYRRNPAMLSDTLIQPVRLSSVIYRWKNYFLMRSLSTRAGRQAESCPSITYRATRRAYTLPGTTVSERWQHTARVLQGKLQAVTLGCWCCQKWQAATIWQSSAGSSHFHWLMPLAYPSEQQRPLWSLSGSLSAKSLTLHITNCKVGMQNIWHSSL